MKVRQNGRIVSVAVIVTIGVNSDGRREILGMDIGPSEAETFWTAFLRKLARRGLRGVKLVISDAHEGIKAAVAKVLNATWQRCRVHFMRNALAHAGKSGRRVVSAFIATAFAQDEAEADGLAYTTFPAPHRCPAALNQPDRAPQRRDQAAHQCRRHLPQRGRHRSPRRRDPARADRRVGRPARPLITLETIAPLSDDPAVSLPAIDS